jgi:hypothetical protein
VKRRHLTDGDQYVDLPRVDQFVWEQTPRPEAQARLAVLAVSGKNGMP